MKSSGKTGKSAPANEPFSDFACDENQGIEAYQFADEVAQRVSDLGLVERHRPRLEEDHKGIFHDLKPGQVFDGRLPTVIRRLSLDQLSALYSLFSNYYAYLVFKTRLIASERSEAIRQKEFLWSHIRSQYKRMVNQTTGKKLFTDQAASDETRHDSRFVEYSAKYEQLNALYNVLSAMCDVAEQDMKVISREVTIQQEKLRQQLVGQGFGRRGDPDEVVGESSYGNAPTQATQGPAPAGRRVVRPEKRPEKGPKPSGRARVSGRRPKVS